MRKLALFLLGVLLFLLVFWLGFMANFPGKALSLLIASRVNKLPGIGVTLAPAELTWTSLTIPRLSLEAHAARLPKPLLTLTDVTIPIGWKLLDGLPAQGTLGKQGRLEVYVPWNGKELSVRALQLRLEEIPALAALQPVKLRGGISFSGSLRFPERGRGGASTRLPEGTITGQGEALQVDNLEIMGAKLPPTRLERVDLRLKSGRRLEVERLEFQGDVQGKITGAVTPRLANPDSSGLQLRIAVSFRKSWLEQLGAMRPVVEAFLRNGRLEAALSGTVGRPRFNIQGGARK
ncbi:MAG: type II secretion system protein GspN [SAR324 cluster bacterium]|nr:type II secretion system protein GspN [SAR324 cluster bacterium]